MKVAGTAALVGSAFMLGDIAEHEVPAEDRLAAVDFVVAQYPVDAWRLKRLSLTGCTFMMGAALIAGSRKDDTAPRKHEE